MRPRNHQHGPRARRPEESHHAPRTALIPALTPDGAWRLFAAFKQPTDPERKSVTQMRDKMVRNRRKSSLSVESSVEIHGEQVVAGLEKDFADRLQEGEAMPPFLMILLFLQRMLATAREGLVSVAARHLVEIDGDNKTRRRRDELSKRLEVKGRRIRDVLDRIFGEGAGLEIAGLDRRTAQEPVDMLAQTERIMERLRNVDVEAQQPELPGFVMDPESLIADLEPDYRELSEVVQDVNRENRRSDATLITKNKAMEENDLVFRYCASVLAGFYGLAGHEELARRVTPSIRRGGRTRAEVAAEEKGDAQAPGDQPEPTESEAAG